MNDFEHIRHMTSGELAVLGMQYLAYIKPVVVDGVTAFAIHAADGTQVAVLPDRDVALATIRHHDLEPMSLH